MCRIENYAFAIPCGSVLMHDGVQAALTSATQTHLKYYRVPSRVRYPKPEPIIWIPDTIASSPTKRAPAMLSSLSRIRNIRDFIWLETRGTGHNGVGCIDANPSSLRQYFNRFDDPEWVGACLKKLERFGGASRLDYRAIALDYEQLAQQLKLDNVIVIAEGKGFEVLREWYAIAPARLSVIIIDSPVVQSSASLFKNAEALGAIYQTHLQRCQENEACRTEFYPEANPITALRKRLPENTYLRNPLTGATEKIQINDSVLVQMVSQLLRQPQRADLLFPLIQAAKNGHWQPWVNLTALTLTKRQNSYEHANAIVEQCLAYEPNQKAPNIFTTDFAQSLYALETERLKKLCQHSMLDHQASRQSRPPLQYTPPTIIMKGGLNPLTHDVSSIFPNAIMLNAPNAAVSILQLGCSRDILYHIVRQLDQHVPVGSIQFDDQCLTSIERPALPLYEMRQLNAVNKVESSHSP